MRLHLILLFAMCVCGAAWAAPRPESSAAWDRYAAQIEQRIALERRNPAGERNYVVNEATQRGEIQVDRFQAPDIPSGRIHHWAGTVFIPGATLDDVQAVTSDIASFPRYYAPEVVSARVLSRPPKSGRVVMRLRKDYIQTVVLEAEYDVRLESVDPTHRYSSSRSVRIQEVRNFGEFTEALVPPEEDHGFLWAMNSYWSYVQVADGVYVRCETLSFSRDIPTGLGWLLAPVVNRLPRESLRRTLESTRKAVLNSRSASLSGKMEGLR